MDHKERSVATYIENTKLLGVPHHIVPHHRVLYKTRVAGVPEIANAPEVTQGPPFNPEKNTDQAAVVGGGLTTFANGVPAEVRYPLIHCFVFASMAGNAADPGNTDPDRWYGAYFTAIRNLAYWVLGGPPKLNTFTTADTNVTVHNAILKVAQDLLGGPAAGAYTLVKDALTGLESSGGQTPWFTLFQQHSQYASVGRCQISVTTQDATGLINLSLMAFNLEAQSTLTQVLFFKFESAHATLKWRGQQATIDEGGLMGIDDRIVARLAKVGVGPQAPGWIEEVPLRS